MMKMRPTPVLAAAALAAGAASAATTTADFNVQLTIQAECLINAATDLVFGPHGVLAANVDTTSTITVQCTTATPYTIGLSLGSGVGATAALRYMTGPSSQTVGYSLYSDAGYSDVWGPTISVDTVGGSGTGDPEPYIVYGRVAPQTTPGVGAYADIITATVTY